MNCKSKHKIIYGLLILIVCILVGIWFLQPIITKKEVITPTEPAKPVSIYVYVTGAIEQPGVYEVTEDATWSTLLEKAGPLLPYADISQVPMAEPFQQTQHLHIPFAYEGRPEALLRKEKININQASVDELRKLSGVGPSIAKRIVEYRQEKGPFTTVEDIMNVKGIGHGMFKKWEAAITV